MNNKKGYNTIIIILAALILFAVAGFLVINNKKTDDSQSDNQQETINNELEEISYDKGNNLEEALSVCEKINSEDSRNFCIAMLKGDDSFCLNEEDEDNCYFFMAHRKNDPKLCEKVSNMSFCLGTVTGDYEECNNNDSCYYEIAVETKDSKGCELISNERFADICFAFTKKDPSFLIGYEDLNFQMQDYYMSLAMIYRDASVCENIENEEVKKICMAFSGGDKSDLDCTNIDNLLYCSFLAQETQDVSICDSMPEDNQTNVAAKKSDCYLNVALNLYSLPEISVLEESSGGKEIFDSNESTEISESICEYKKGEYEMRFYDAQGRVSGVINGEVFQEIPKSVVYQRDDIQIRRPPDYIECEIFCIREGNYKLTQSHTIQGEEIVFKAINIPISPGQTHRYKINWEDLSKGEDVVTLVIDSDKDGEFDKTMSIQETEFSCEQFLEKINSDSQK